MVRAVLPPFFFGVLLCGLLHPHCAAAVFGAFYQVTAVFFVLYVTLTIEFGRFPKAERRANRLPLHPLKLCKTIKLIT